MYQNSRGCHGDLGCLQSLISIRFSIWLRGVLSFNIQRPKVTDIYKFNLRQHYALHKRGILKNRACGSTDTGGYDNPRLEMDFSITPGLIIGVYV